MPQGIALGDDLAFVAVGNRLQAADVLSVAFFLDVLEARLDAHHVRFDDRGLSAECVLEHRLDRLQVDAEQGRQHADVNHVALLDAERRGRDDILDELVCGDAEVLDAVAL